MSVQFDEALATAQTADLATLLHMAPEEMTELRNALLAHIIELVYEGHPYYGAVMRRLRLTPADIVTIDDLQKLPPTSKRDFLADPGAFRLQCPSLPAEMQALWEVVYTTGTSTGVPAPVYTTTFDHLSYMHNSQRRRSFIPIREDDVVVNLFPLTPFPTGAYARAAAEVAAYGAALVTAHTGRPPAFFGGHRSIGDAARLVVAHRATVLYGVAGFVRRLLIHAERNGTSFSSVRMVMVTGQASSRRVLDDIRRRLAGLGSSEALVINRYGSTEQGSSMVECEPGRGFHNLAPDQIFPEVLDPGTSERLPDGEQGLLAFTHLLRRGTVLLRYMPGDIASLERAPCPSCGCTSTERMSPDVRRVGGIQKVKGTLVDLDSLREHLEGIPELEEFQLVLRSSDPEWPEAADELVVRFACGDRVEAKVRAAVEGVVDQIGHLRPILERCAASEIFNPDEMSKPRRIVDQREALRS